MIKLYLAKESDIKRTMEIINQAKAYFKQNGVDQWQQGYPDENSIAKDICEQKGYMLSMDEEIVGYLCLDFDGEASYNSLKGQWNNPDDYAVIHRLAIDNRCKGKGLASKAYKLVENICLEKGVHSIRADTDMDNVNMRHSLEKNGFKYCGTVFFDYSDKVAYEKVF